jgi:putative nucleotidyltransferase with HDIG domain
LTTTAQASTATAQAAGQLLPPHLQKAVSRVTEITALPEITTRIMDVVEDPKATAHDMHEIVKSDPALAAKILKVVNSAFYGLPAQIASLDRAIIMLGLSAVKNIALAASLSRLFKPEPISEHFAPRDLWLHSVAVGVCAKMLARADSKDFAEEVFVAGLVHDMGLLIEHQLFPDQLRESANRCFGQPQDFCTVEQQIIGADHPAFGATLAAKWKFPAGLRNAIAYHHDPSRLKPEFRRLARYIYIADTYCCQGRHGFWLTAATQEITDEMLDEIKISQARMDELLETLPDQVDEAQRVFSE